MGQDHSLGFLSFSSILFIINITSASCTHLATLNIHLFPNHTTTTVDVNLVARGIHMIVKVLDVDVALGGDFDASAVNFVVVIVHSEEIMKLHVSFVHAVMIKSQQQLFAAEEARLTFSNLVKQIAYAELSATRS